MSCLQLQLLNLDDRIANLRRPLLWSIVDKKQQHQQNTEAHLVKTQPLVVNLNLQRDDYDYCEKTQT